VTAENVLNRLGCLTGILWLSYWNRAAGHWS